MHLERISCVQCIGGIDDKCETSLTILEETSGRAWKVFSAREFKAIIFVINVNIDNYNGTMYSLYFLWREVPSTRDGKYLPEKKYF